MLRAMNLKQLGTACAAALLLVPSLSGAEETPSATPPPAPPTPAAAPAEAVTQPFKPAVRVVPRALPVTALGPMTNLLFDAEVKEHKMAAGVFEHDFTFSFTNASGTNVVIQSVRTSCGCTVARMPAMPWTNAPGASGTFGIHMDLRGKSGSITKSVFIMTDQGNKTVYVRGIVADAPAMNDGDRERNLMIAKANRQAVFKGECASCHATPAFGKTGSQLYEAACGICHEGAHRNEMVPDLSIAKQARDFEYWRQWIANGKEGTLMPGFGKAHEGGPLTDAQIMSLAHFLTRKFPNPQNLPANRPAAEPAVNR